MDKIPTYLTRTYDHGNKVLNLDYRIWIVAILLALSAAVEFVTRTGIIPRFSLVPVSTMVERAAVLLTTGHFYIHNVIPTAGAILLSFAIATVLGVIIGFLISEYRLAQNIFEPYITSYYAIPMFALYPLFVVLLGQGLLSITILGVLFSMVAIIMQARDGFSTLPLALRKLSRSEGIYGAKFFFKILLPNAFPHILSGMRIGFVYAVVGVLACEFILATKGLGHFVAYSYAIFATKDMYAGMLIILVLSWLSVSGMSRLLGRFSWRDLD